MNRARPVIIRGVLATLGVVSIGVGLLPPPSDASWFAEPGLMVIMGAALFLLASVTRRAPR